MDKLIFVLLCLAPLDYVNTQELRLVGGRTPFEGRVEIRINGVFGTVCDDLWDARDAQVVCRQLGITNGTAFAVANFGGGVGSIHLDNVQCTGSESVLTDCSSNPIVDCVHSEDAGVICFAEPECNDTDIRLVGPNPLVGRVEVCFGGVWGTVCNDFWDDTDATVVCRQLGFAAGDDEAFTEGSGSGPIFLDNVECDLTDSRLDECSHNGINNHNCAHSKDAGVICRGAVLECTVEGEVQLFGTVNSREGRVEICQDGSWHALCGDGWDQTEVSVVCQQLGFSSENALLANFGRGGSPRLTSNISCFGNESSLTECLSLMDSSLICNQYAGVQCEAPCLSAGFTTCCSSDIFCQEVTAENPVCYCNSVCFQFGDCCRDILHVQNCFATLPTECSDGDVRLVGGTSGTNGRVEVCMGGQWGGICDADSSWDRQNAQVVCRQLGFSPEDARVLPPGAYEEISLNVLSLNGLILIGGVHCSGSEIRLDECLHDTTGRHSCRDNSILFRALTASIVCEEAQCTDGEVRLINGTANTNGRVEICYRGVWGTVCDDSWDDVDASVVCRQLGFEANGAVATEVANPFGRVGPIFLDEVNCAGNESRLEECSHPGFSVHDCQHEEDAGVLCSPGAMTERCNGDMDTNSVSETIPNLERFGRCQRYEGRYQLCNEFFDAGSDFVYIPQGRGSQSEIANELSMIESAFSLASARCQELVLRVVCHYYFIPCGRNGTQFPPTSICSEECSFVESSCSGVFNTIEAILDNSEMEFIDCTNPAAVLNPLPSCCTGVGVVIQSPSPSPNPGPSPNSSTSNGNTTAALVGGAVGGVLILVVVMLVVIGALFCGVRMRRMKAVHRLQMDVRTVPGQVQSSSAAVENGAAEGFAAENEGLKEDKSPSHPSGAAVSNPYSKHEMTVSTSSLPKPQSRSRVSSSYIRQLSGHMLIVQDRIELLECIGQGEFGIVYKATLTLQSKGRVKRKRTVAVKTLKGYFDQNEITKIMEESIKMKHFDHPNVLTLIGVCMDAGPAPYIIMPFMANGSLLAYLRKERKDLIMNSLANEDLVLDVKKRLTVICNHIATGMEYLAGERFVHRDLAARNCMIDTHFVIKIADFGLSEDVYARNYFRQGADTTVKLPVKWMAPESLQDSVFSEKSDVWSFGITCWEVFSGGKTPYPGVDPLYLVQMLENGQRLMSPTNAACPDEMYSIMLKCWTAEPDERPSFSEIASNISLYLEQLAGYLDINYNPFSSAGRASTLTDVGESWTEGEGVLEEEGVIDEGVQWPEIRVTCPSEDGSNYENETKF